MAVNLTNVDSALKSFYADAVAEQINNNTNPFLTMINKTSTDIWGKDIRKLVVTGANGGFASGTETGDLPTSSGCRYETFTQPLKNLYGTIEISDKAMRASENNSGAFVNLLNAEMETLIGSTKRNLGRMLFGDGSGRLATVLDCVDHERIMVDSVKNIEPGMIIDFIDIHGKVMSENTKRIIVDVDRDKRTILISPNLSKKYVDDIAFITIQGSLNNEIDGLESIFSQTDKLYGLDRNTHKFLNPYIKLQGRRITLEAIQEAIDKIEETSGNPVNYILCSFGVKRAIRNLLIKEGNVDIVTLGGGYNAISYNGIPVVSDRYCPDGTMYLLNTNDFDLHQLCDWVWLESGNGSILQLVPGKPIYTATLVKYANLMCSKPFGQGKIYGIVED